MEQAGFPFDIAIVDRRIEPSQMCSMHSKPIRRFMRIGNVEIALCDDCLMSAKACIDAEASVVKRKLEGEEGGRQGDLTAHRGICYNTRCHEQ